MTVGEITKRLILADDYIIERSKVSDQMIDMVRSCMPGSYELIEDREYAYQELLKIFGGENADS